MSVPNAANRPSFYRPLVLRLLQPLQLGYLRLELPGGGVMEYGSKENPLHAEIKICREDFFRRCVLAGDIGFGEAFVEGDWETPDLTKVIEWMILNVENHPTLMADKPKQSVITLLKFLDNFQHRLRSNTVRGSRKNIAAHYDLGNAFYQLFLDETMTYSCAYFENPESGLGAAQTAKYEKLCRKIRLKRTDHVLEIGSGWGGFAEHAARRYGCRVTGVTISKEQLSFAKERIEKAGLRELVDFQLLDYRHIKGSYDKIVSIEMIEAVGHEHLKTYFACCHRLLKKEGVLALQAILAPDHRYESFRKKSDWIQKYIFPGGLLPSFDAIHRAVRETGSLGLLDYDDLTLHYARTLQIWRNRFNAQAEALERLGFDAAFRRKWNYYFSYCEAAFSMRNISLAQVVFSRPNNHSL